MLVTGGTGFLGRAIMQSLRDAGHDPRSLQRRPSADDTSALSGDVRDEAALTRALQGADAVIHAAGLAHVFRGVAQAPFADVNERGTDVVARAAVSSGVAHFVLISSVAVYGDGPGRTDEDAPCRPVGPYAVSKAAAEGRAIAALRGSPVRLTILRVATLYGEGDRGNVQRLLRAISRGRFVWIGRGTNRKTLVHVADAARACVLPLARRGDAVEVYNVAAPPVTMRAVVEGLARALGRAVPSWHLPPALALALARAARPVMPAQGRALEQAIVRWLSDDVYPAEKLSRRFDFEPRVALAEGLERQVAWWRRSARDGSGC